MMDKNGKLFGKISIVDALAVFAVIIVALGIYVRFFGGPSKTVVQSSKFMYTALVKSIRASNVEALEKSIGGSVWLDEKITADLGRLVSVEKMPATTFAETADGMVVKSPVPDRYDAVITVEINGKVNENGYFSQSLEHISAGAQYNFKTKWSAVVGVIQKVWQE